MKVSFVQFQPLLGKPDETIERLQKLLPQTSGSDLIVLPELANSGYNFISREQAYELSEEIEKSRFLSYLEQWSKETGVYIVTGINEREKGLLYNSSVLIGPDNIIGKYRKIHLFMNEKDIFEPGNFGLPVFKIENYNLGMLICFDYLFPEIWRILALKGADIICHPSNLVTPYGQKVVPSHCIINRIFAITANRIGTEGNITFSGGSIICSPEGENLATGPENNECVGTVEIDIAQARNKWITERNHAINDRRPDQYSGLI